MNEEVSRDVTGRRNYSVKSNNINLVHWPLMGGLLHLVQRGGDWAGPSPPRPLLAVPNVTAHPSTASVPITVLVCNGPLLCGFNVVTKGLIGNCYYRMRNLQATLSTSRFGACTAWHKQRQFSWPL